MELNPAMFDEGFLARFRSRFQQRDLDECWNWTSTLNDYGYGIIWFDNHNRGAHRVAYALSTGEILVESDVICHKCDNSVCVNPRHLFKGTHEINARDRHAKGRTKVLHGAVHPNTHLTEDDAKAIREKYLDGEIIRVIATQYNVSEAQVQRIGTNQAWKLDAHVPARPRVLRRGNLTNAPRGVDRHNAKLSEDDVREIRRRHAAGECTNHLARIYNVVPSTIYKIVTHKKWAHIL
jgi:HNH endonuclease/helix-turn-helix resolvase-like protein